MEGGQPVPVATRMTAPQQEHHWTAVQCRQCAPGDLLPTEPAVGTGFPLLDGQDVIQQEHTLPRPRIQVAVGRRGAPTVPGNLLVDVAQRGGNGHALGHRKGESVGLPRSVVWVLAEDAHPHVVRCADCAERVKPHRGRGVTRGRPIGVLQRPAQGIGHAGPEQAAPPDHLSGDSRRVQR